MSNLPHQELPLAYVVRADFGRHTRAFMNGNYIGIGWLKNSDLGEAYKQGKEALRSLYVEDEPDASKMRVAVNVGQIWRFLDEVKIGSYVVTPAEETSTLIVGRLISEYYYEPHPMDSPFPHRKKVEWFKKPLLRNTLSVPAQNSIRSSLTVFQLTPPHEFLEPFGIFLPEISIITDEEITKLILDEILELSADDFEILVTELLSAIGFDAQHVGKTGDDGIDVRGTLRVYDFASVDLSVQVKRYKSGKINQSLIKQFRSSVPERSQAAFVTTSDFNSAAREEAEKEGFKKIGLINGVQLVGILIEHYDDLDQAVREKLNLRKTLIPTLLGK